MLLVSGVEGVSNRDASPGAEPTALAVGAGQKFRPGVFSFSIQRPVV